MAAAVAASVVAAPMAAAAPADILYDCQADTPLGAENLTLNQTVDTTAPATVAPGGALDLVVDPAPNQVPSEAAGYKVKDVNTFTLKVPVPTNSTLTGVDLTGGSGLGSDPAWTEAGGVVTVTFAGPIAGGATFELPTITAHLTAGASGPSSVPVRHGLRRPGPDVHRGGRHVHRRHLGADVVLPEPQPGTDVDHHRLTID